MKFFLEFFRKLSDQTIRNIPVGTDREPENFLLGVLTSIFIVVLL